MIQHNVTYAVSLSGLLKIHLYTAMSESFDQWNNAS